MDYFEIVMRVGGNLLISFLVFLAYLFGRYFFEKYKSKWKAIILILIVVMVFVFGVFGRFEYFDEALLVLFFTFIIPGLLGAVGMFRSYLPWERETEKSKGRR